MSYVVPFRVRILSFLLGELNIPPEPKQKHSSPWVYTGSETVPLGLATAPERDKALLYQQRQTPRRSTQAEAQYASLVFYRRHFEVYSKSMVL